MKILIFISMLFTTVAFCQNKDLPTIDVWNISEVFQIKKDIRTTITLAEKDTSEKYCLFDNKLNRDITIRFILSGEYWVKRNNFKEDLVLPLPPLRNKVYCIEYTSSDTTFVKKFVHIK